VKSKAFSLLLSIAICQAAGLIGSFFTAPAIPTWYATLQKPSFSPPNWLFAPVWISLYALMGIALFLIWQKGWQKKSVKQALTIFGFQLGLNSLWSIIFFGFQSPFWALVEIIILWGLILLTIIKFKPLSKTASLLLVPYLLWTTFATILNFAIARLN